MFSSAFMFLWEIPAPHFECEKHEDAHGHPIKLPQELSLHRSLSGHLEVTSGGVGSKT